MLVEKSPPIEKLKSHPPGLQLGQLKHAAEAIGDDATDDAALHTLGKHELPPGAFFFSTQLTPIKPSQVPQLSMSLPQWVEGPD